jgi:polar amino acid transport system substrate-binding protein
MNSFTERLKKITGVVVVLLLQAGILLADDKPPLRVGVTLGLPPMVFKQNDQITGIEADFARALGKELGREVKFVELDWEDEIPTLLDGKIDIIMSSMSITTARQIRVAFCDPYMQTGQMALIRRESMYEYAFGFPVAPQGTIGVKKATTGDFLVQQEFPRSKRKEFSSGEDAAKALIKKRINVFVSDATLVWWLASEHEADGLTPVPTLLTNEQLAWAVRKSDTNLLASANTVMAKWQKDGTAMGIIKRWLPGFGK